MTSPPCSGSGAPSGWGTDGTASRRSAVRPTRLLNRLSLGLRGIKG